MLFGVFSLNAGLFPQDPDPAEEPVMEDDSEETIEDDDSELREGTVIVEDNNEIPADSLVDEGNFIRYSANIIQMNGDDWTELKGRFRETGYENFSILHIGDSHLQADIATGEVRRLFQESRGNGGRGLIVPFRLAGTNEPSDYKFTLSCGSNVSKLLKKPWVTDMNFTGIGVSPKDHAFDLTIENLGDVPNRFRFVRIYSTGEYNITDAKTQSGYPLKFSVDRNTEDGYTDIFLDRNVSDIIISFYAPSTMTFHGAMLTTEEPGVIYNVIGNNGATYHSYSLIEDFGKGASTLYPDLIILSMGTNEAFGKLTPSEFRAQLNRLIAEIRQFNPESKLLLTTPKECQRRITTGRKWRRRTSYSVVNNCNLFRNVILEYGKDNKIPVYDWYDIAGGDGSSTYWVKNGLLSQDRIHNTHSGYLLFGGLFYSALERALN